MLRLCVQLICLIVRAWRARVSRRFATTACRGDLRLWHDVAERLPDSLDGVHRRRPGVSIGLRRHLLPAVSPDAFPAAVSVADGNLHSCGRMPEYRCSGLCDGVGSGLPAGQPSLPATEPGVRWLAGSAGAVPAGAGAPTRRRRRQCQRLVVLSTADPVLHEPVFLPSAHGEYALLPDVSGIDR